ncbi:MAG: type III-A CRISPR-associated protein Csm2 [Candidatus Omnitrophota bacterium]|nr:MAG: type III-A CRISPR-associated protein Csm2 [Candidatus Omnitrophota bacterium]
MNVGNLSPSQLVLNVEINERGRKFGKKVDLRGGLKDALTRDAEKIAKDIGEKIFGKETNPSKVRQYYQVIVRLRDKLKSDSGNASVWNEFYMLKPKAQYDFNRKVINSVFQKFISEAVDKIDSKEDFERFALFFEAVVGFFPKNTAQ